MRILNNPTQQISQTPESNLKLIPKPSPHCARGWVGQNSHGYRRRLRRPLPRFIPLEARLRPLDLNPNPRKTPFSLTLRQLVSPSLLSFCRSSFCGTVFALRVVGSTVSQFVIPVGTTVLSGSFVNRFLNIYSVYESCLSQPLEWNAHMLLQMTKGRGNWGQNLCKGV